ncbi:T-cell-interacting, activating receptor on myeloid cells protein 1-like isoform X1 [Tympanuchus pallidicinctus]|uniref:T-cell-interacting, activating receptor on myeloid cells protein 1-like isoform X1 n=1 Tax=Tympanuchus pallidicinctus TaxID=109042 RepID=UPI002286F383|nr:T-cell-interacting, activating receptor on myeloid cells protein 1-like isoform X1 [Tympanuchus pallidicinctus]
MAPRALALILGWWLAAASGAQQLPPPSLSLHPSHGVSLGDAVTLRCHLPRPAARVEFYKEESWGLVKQEDVDMALDVAEFTLDGVNKEDAVKYWCQYRVSEPRGTSELSDPVELVVTDRTYPLPSISMSSGRNVGTGTNVTIQCHNKYNGVTFLHKDGLSAPIQHQKPDGGGTATFTLFEVTPADSGTYRCSYRPGGLYFLSSPLGENVTLEVTPLTGSQGDNGWPHGTLVAAVAGSCAAAFAFILVLVASFLLAARRRRIQSPGATPRSYEAVQFQVPPADSQALTYAELQALTHSTPPPCSFTTPEPPTIYAEVGTGGPR